MHLADKRTIFDMQRSTRRRFIQPAISDGVLRSGIYNAVGDLHLRALNNAQPTNNTVVEFYGDSGRLDDHTYLGRVAINLNMNIFPFGDNRLSAPVTLHLFALAFRLDYLRLGFVPLRAIIRSR